MNLHGGMPLSPLEAAYGQIRQQRGDGPSTGNNFLGYGSLEAAADALAPSWRQAQGGMAPGMGAPQMAPQGGTAPMALALTLPPANETPMQMSQRYAQALLGSASPPPGTQSVLTSTPPFQVGRQQPSQAEIQQLIANELMRQQPRRQQLSPQQMWAASFGGEGGNSAFGGGGFSGGANSMSSDSVSL